ncbi:hypothetical protein V8D89_000860 [Ganoderma adspersum]
MKLTSSLLVVTLALGASASPFNAPRFGNGFRRPGFGGNAPGAGGAGTATTNVAVGSVAGSATIAEASASGSASVPVASASESASVVDTATAISTTVAVVTATGTAAATSTASAGDNAAGNGAAAGSDPQTSLTLLASLVATGFENNGQDVPEAGQVPSLTSSNNFINFCATVPNLPLTNGAQIKTGSCNPAPMGVIAATTNMPSCKFVFPANGATIPANTNFTIQMAIKNLETGNFVNAQENYFAAPQQVNAQGNIRGHSHITIDPLPSLDSTVPTDPTKFVWFKGLNEPDVNGVLSATVGGLPAGAYRLASINSAANHQPALVAVAQHGSLDDMVYFTVA